MARWFWQGQIIYNPGIAFSWVLPGVGAILVSGGFLVLVTVWFYRYRQLGPAWATACGLIFGGGASNLWERFQFNGAVADYINIWHISTANAADLLIFIGIVYALWLMWRHP